MANAKRKNSSVVGLGVSIICMAMTQAMGAAPTAWNESVRTSILTRSELAKTSEVLPAWKIKQMIWPSSEEMASASVTVNDDLKDAALTWLVRFIPREQIPLDLKEHFVAMRGWGLVRPESEQRRLCDVFISRFQKGPYSVHVQESPGNVVLTIGHEDLPTAGDLDHEALVFQTSRLFLRQELRPNPQSKLLHVSRKEQSDVAITKVMWSIESVVGTDEKGNTYRNGVKAEQLGTWHVTAETDGRFVRFDILKFVNSPTQLDPCMERF